MNVKDLQTSLDYLFEAQMTPFVWGHTGDGKTTVIQDYAKDKGYKFFGLYLGTQGDVGDVLGLQGFTKDKNGSEVATRHAPPAYLLDLIEYCEQNPKSGAILFLDELNHARRDIISGMYTMALDKRFHTLKFPANLHIVAAGNPATDDYNVTDTSSASFLTRFVHIKYEPALTETLSYLESVGVDATILGFLNEAPDRLREKFEDFKLPVKRCPRSYERLGRLQKLNPPAHIFSQLGYGIVGVETMVQYESYLKTADKPLEGADVLEGAKAVWSQIKTWSKKDDMKQTLLHSTAENVIKFIGELDTKNQNLSSDQAKNLHKFIFAVPSEVGWIFVRNLIHKMNKNIIDGLWKETTETKDGKEVVTQTDELKEILEYTKKIRGTIPEAIRKQKLEQAAG